MLEKYKDRLCYDVREFMRLPRSLDDKFNYETGILDTLEALNVSTADYNEMQARVEDILYPQPQPKTE